MKQVEKTMVPRKQALNQALIDAGHKVHSDKRNKKLEKDKKKKALEELLDDEWD